VKSPGFWRARLTEAGCQFFLYTSTSTSTMTSIATWKTYHRPESAVHPAGWHLDRSWTRRNCPCLANRDATFASTRQWFVQSFTSQVDLGCTSSCCCELAGQVMQSDVPPALLGPTRRCASACKSQAGTTGALFVAPKPKYTKRLHLNTATLLSTA
jgi:hypothetical protein